MNTEKEIDYTKIPSVRSFGPIHWIRNRFSKYLTSRFTLNIEGAENLVEAPNGAILCVAPHNGHADALLLYAMIRQIRDECSKTDKEQAVIMDDMLKKLFLLAAADYWADRKKAIVAHLVVRLLLFDRNEGREALKGLQRAADIVAKGGYVALFPEGTRHIDPNTPLDNRELKFGLISVYEYAKQIHPIIPIHFAGTEEIWPKGKWPRLKKRTVDVFIGKKICSELETPGQRKRKIIEEIDEFYKTKE